MTTMSAVERAELRKSLRQYRRSLSDEQQSNAAHALLNTLINWPAFVQANTVAAYLPNDGEIALTPVLDYLQAQGKRICLPVIHPFCRHHLLFLQWSEHSQMTKNRFGISEPVLACQNVIPVDHIDMVLLPLVGFDLAKNRLGMGGGFYDRTFARRLHGKHSTPVLVGVAHDGQQVSSLPYAPWDVPVDRVATPSRLIGA